jgi:hypothetical protein
MLAAMPSTTVVVACVVGIAILLVGFLVARSRGKAAEPVAPRFEPPRELAKRPTKEKPEAKPAVEPTANEAVPFLPSSPAADAEKPKTAEVWAEPVTPAASPDPEDDGGEKEEATSPDAIPLLTEEIVVDAIVEAQPVEQQKTADAPMPAPPLPRSDSKLGAPRPPMPSYSSITDETVAEDVRQESVAPAPVIPSSEPKAAAKPAPISEPKAKPAEPKPTSEPKVAAPKPASEPKVAAPKPASEPKVAAPKPASEPKVAAPRLPVSEPRVPAKALPTSEPKVAAPELPVAKREVAEPVAAAARRPADEHDFSALNDTSAASKAATGTAAATVAKFVPPSNPATAELEKNDPRHAAARRLARVSVSEIKLYHEDEVKAGREAKDLWKRLQQDIALAKQTFEARVVPEVRARFDYLYDEILRQLAEGDASKLGPDAPVPSAGDAAPAAAAPADNPTAPPPAATAPGRAASDSLVDYEAPTRTNRRTLEPAEPTAPSSAAEAPKPAAPPPTAAAPAHSAAAPGAAAAKPTGIAARALPTNPETAELEKNDPKHAAARRLARLSVSEIKLYHEDEVKAGREAKDLWKRMNADIALATQTFEKRVDKEVRDRFDYLYDEILRQLAEGDVAKLGPEAPAPKKAPAPEPPTPALKVLKVEEAKPAAVAPVAPAGLAGRYAPPSNPATAELEKNDPRHAAARRLARLSVSEIKLYHEDEVKAGREAKDLWKRMSTDIGLATQTYEKRVDKEVRDRFDYLYDEILRQLAEGDVAKLGPDAPKPKAEA